MQFSSFSPSKYDFYFCSHEINVCLLSGTCNIVGFYTTVLLSWVRVRVFMFIFCYANRQVPSWVTLFLLFLFVSLNFCVCYRSTVKDLFIYYCSQIFRINDICVMNVRKYSVWSCQKCYGEKKSSGIFENYVSQCAGTLFLIHVDCQRCVYATSLSISQSHCMFPIVSAMKQRMYRVAQKVSHHQFFEKSH